MTSTVEEPRPRRGSRTARRGGTARERAPARRPAARPERAERAERAERVERAERAEAIARSAPPRAPFVVLIVGLLSGALVSLLLLNTVLAKDAFELTRLQRSVKQFDQQRQAMESEVAREESPQRLARKAENLGMEQPTQLAFIDPHTRRVVGGAVRPVPHDAAAAASAAAALGVPGVVIPGDGVTTAAQRP
ncbi:hypothetical protein [Thermomonospora umbrina]|uniref:Cell division protein FtsL n=1 Tax=Thermomonospora umbrina TaxID=111806 RepID=A0A3D9SUP3_9ACTN|nr:hypothetical protein [Thermomonospora umbrina]REE99682.1 hypothetical protein DFJ69_5196 [Thermomonospora umbrina]